MGAAVGGGMGGPYGLGVGMVVGLTSMITTGRYAYLAAHPTKDLDARAAEGEEIRIVGGMSDHGYYKGTVVDRSSDGTSMHARIEPVNDSEPVDDLITITGMEPGTYVDRFKLTQGYGGRGSFFMLEEERDVPLQDRQEWHRKALITGWGTAGAGIASVGAGALLARGATGTRANIGQGLIGFGVMAFLGPALLVTGAAVLGGLEGLSEVPAQVIDGAKGYAPLPME